MTISQIATPGHELYGKHVTQDVIDAMIAPKDESKQLVLDWLSSEGLVGATVSPRGNTIMLEATVSQLEKLLDAEYNVYSKNHLPKLLYLHGPVRFSGSKGLEICVFGTLAYIL